MQARQHGRLRRSVGHTALELVLPVIIVVLYQRWASGAKDPYFPPIPKILTAFKDMWWGDGFSKHIVPSLANLFRGYLLGLIGGVIVGVALWRIPLVRRALQPVFSFVLTLPPVALLPFFIVALSIGTTLQVGIIVYAVFFTIAINTADSLRAVDATLDDISRSFHIHGWRRVAQVMLPAAAPQILAAARSSLSVALLVMIVSELVGASRGIGVATFTAQQSFRYDQMWAGMLLLAVLGYLLNWVFSRLEAPLLRRLGVASETSVSDQ